MTYTRMGRHRIFGFRVLVHEGNDPLGDILAHAQLHDQFRIRYLDEEDSYEFYSRHTDELELVTKNRNGLHYIYPATMGHYWRIHSHSLTFKPKDDLHYLHRLLGHYGKDSLKRSTPFFRGFDHLHEGHFSKIDIECSGCDTGLAARYPVSTTIGGKNRKLRGANQRNELTDSKHNPLLDPRPGEVVHMDIVFVSGFTYLLAVDEKTHYTYCQLLDNKSAPSLVSALDSCFGKFRSFRKFHPVVECRTDREVVLSALKDPLLARGVRSIQTAAGVHERLAESTMRKLRECIRCVLQDFVHKQGFHLPSELLGCVFEEMVHISNYLVVGKRQKPALAVALDRNVLDLPPCPFGEIGVFRNPTRTSPTDPISSHGIVIGTEEQSRALKVWIPGRVRPIVYRDIGKRISHLPDHIKSSFAKNKAISLENIRSWIPEDTDSQDAPKVDPEDEDEDDLDFEEGMVDDTHAAPTHSVEHRSSTRIPQTNVRMAYAKSYRSAFTLGAALRESTTRQDSEEGRIESIKEELRSLIRMKTFRAIHPDEAASLGAKQVGARMITDRKLSALNKFVRWKSRLVAQGYSYEYHGNPYSPTIALDTTLLMSAIIMQNGYKPTVIDVKNAYLHSDIDDTVTVRLSPEVATVLCDLDPSYGDYRRPDGTILLLLQKALYGLSQSGKLFYQTISGFLIEAGFTRSDYDPALFFKKDKGRLSMLIVHVDDIKIAMPEKAKKELIQKLRDRFKNITVDEDATSLEYLGVVFKYSNDCCTLLQPGLIQELVENVTAESEMPFLEDLMDNPNAPLLDKFQATNFRSVVMTLSYLTDRSRPDIKLPVAILTTRISNPSQDDQKKLDLLLGYLKHTQHLGLTFGNQRIEELHDSKRVRLTASADASWANDKDGKSRQGGIVWVNEVPVWIKSQRQPFVATSTTAAELIALSAVVEQIRYLRLILEELGYQVPPAEIQQDNKSAITIATSGQRKRTKTLEAKYFMVKEDIEANKVKLVYIRSKDMMADALTKAIPKAEFLRWRDKILGLNQESGE